jgi:sugar lactone lactonase YvrE
MGSNRFVIAWPFALLMACGATVETGGKLPGGGAKDASVPGGGGPDGGGGGGPCVDKDGDGFGTNCKNGPDCNDDDKNIHAGCGGDVVDEVGGPGKPLDPKDDGSSGVKSDPNGSGGIVIDPSNFSTTKTPLIWVANSAEGTVSKIETRTLKEVARYKTGPGNSDPSRTTVGLAGDVVVGNRFGHGATKISSDVARCVDKNGNGKIDTSTGPGDVLAWGQDECVLWTVQFPDGSITRAAAYDAQVGPDGTDASSVWLGLFGRSEMRQLDAATGKELAVVNVAPARPYGAAIDKDGNVWVQGTGTMGRIDGKTRKWSTIQDPPCPPYGIACDPQGRVWVSGQNGCIARYTPGQNKWDATGRGGFNRGLAVDAKGSVWVADTGFGVHQVDVNTLQIKKDLQIGFGNFVGMAVDFDGDIWAISQGSARAVKISPANYAWQDVKVGNGPYTYSDMTGFQLRNAGPPTGIWRHVFPGCGKDAHFNTLAWTASLPIGSALVIRARVAADVPSLAMAPWIAVATVPPDMPPIDLAKKLGAKANVGGFMEVEFTLKALTPDGSPILSSVKMTMSCSPGIG